VLKLLLPGSRARIVRCGGRYDPQLVKRSSEWVLKLGKTYQWENCLTTTNCACRRCGRSPSPSLVYAERLSQCGPLDCRLSQQCSTFTLCQGITGNGGFLTKFLLTKRLHSILKTWHGENDGYSWKKLTPFDEIYKMYKKMYKWLIVQMYKNWQIRVHMNCQQICKISHKKDLTEVKIFQKSFRGLLFWNTL